MIEGPPVAESYATSRDRHRTLPSIFRWPSSNCVTIHGWCNAHAAQLDNRRALLVAALGFARVQVEPAGKLRCRRHRALSRGRFGLGPEFWARGAGRSLSGPPTTTTTLTEAAVSAWGERLIGPHVAFHG